MAPPEGTADCAANLSGGLEPDAQLARSLVVFPRAASVLAQKVEDVAGVRVRELHGHRRPVDAALDDDVDPDGGANRAKDVGHGDLVERNGDHRWQARHG